MEQEWQVWQPSVFVERLGSPGRLVDGRHSMTGTVSSLIDQEKAGFRWEELFSLRSGWG